MGVPLGMRPVRLQVCGRIIDITADIVEWRAGVICLCYCLGTWMFLSKVVGLHQ